MLKKYILILNSGILLSFIKLKPIKISFMTYFFYTQKKKKTILIYMLFYPKLYEILIIF